MHAPQNEPITLDDSDEEGGAQAGVTAAGAAADAAGEQARRSSRNTRYRSTADKFEVPCFIFPALPLLVSCPLWSQVRQRGGCQPWRPPCTVQTAHVILRIWLPSSRLPGSSRVLPSVCYPAHEAQLPDLARARVYRA